MEFFKIIELQEPSFKQVIIVYRMSTPPPLPPPPTPSSSPQSPSSGEISGNDPTYSRLRESKRPSANSPLYYSKKNRAIHIKSFLDIPMADTEVVFPEKKIYVKTIDMIKLVVMIVLGFVAVYAKISESGDFGKIFLIAIALLGVRIFQTWQAMQTARQRVSDLMTQTLYSKSLDSQSGVLFYLMDAMEEQEQKESMIAYSLLLQNPQGLTESELDKICEVYLKKEFEVDVDFEIDDSLAKLTSEHLVDKNGEKYFAVPLKTALQRLDKKWDNIFSYN